MDLPTRILRTFNHKSIDQLVWQPSIMYWYNSNKVNKLTKDTYPQVAKFVPENYIGIDIIDLYKDIKGSIRYPHETLELHSFYTEIIPGSDIEVQSSRPTGEEEVTILKTPVGKLVQKRKYGFPVEYYVKKIEDLNVIDYYLDSIRYKFNHFMFEAAQEAIEDLGIVQTYNFRSPYQRLVIDFLGFITTTKFLKKYPPENGKIHRTP
ncbi:MAG: hypothetical protein ACTSXU_08980 [Promethearchaeota archaeon]